MKNIQGRTGNDLIAINADEEFMEPVLFRISGKHRNLMLKNIRYFDPAELYHVPGSADIYQLDI